MSWLFAATALAGMILGSAFRAPALVAASVTGAIAFAVAGAFGGHSALSIVGIVAAGLATLQVAYIAGLAAGHVLGFRGRHPKSAIKSGGGSDGAA